MKINRTDNIDMTTFTNTKAHELKAAYETAVTNGHFSFDFPIDGRSWPVICPFAHLMLEFLAYEFNDQTIASQVFPTPPQRFSDTG